MCRGKPALLSMAMSVSVSPLVPTTPAPTSQLSLLVKTMCRGEYGGWYCEGAIGGSMCRDGVG
jgi:hypothetical protein